MPIKWMARACSLALLGTVQLAAESGHDAWLRYRPIEEISSRDLLARLPAAITSLNRSPEVLSAQKEIVDAVSGFTGNTLRTSSVSLSEDQFVLGTVTEVRQTFPRISLPSDLSADGYWLKSTAAEGHRIMLIVSPSDRGVLYGAFALIRRIALRESMDPVDEESNPAAPIRWVNQWDNLNGTIERGYAGRSIFFDNDQVVTDLSRAADYARLLASVGINGCTINNVNANPRALTSEFLPQVARVAAAFRPWGVRISLAVDFSSPKQIGGLDTFDPLDPRVIAWWGEKADEIYRLIPDFAGFVLKADSEGRVGPSTYGRTHAQAANLLANAVKPHGGALIYRGFVYDHHMDWRNLKNDRARAAYDNFHALDGQFADNALVQIKYGPIDFQAREPVSPLIGSLQRTNETMELQITQEYTGQQRHICYLVPMWKEVLDFDLRVHDDKTLVKNIVSGRTFHRPLGGFVGVANVGRDENWLGNDLAMANLYGFARLAWNADLSARQITEEWTRMTFGNDSRVVNTVMALEMESWRVYEGYTGPLGLGTLTDILRGHYGPGIESAERNGWGQWIRADHQGIGMDRTQASGTGYISQYPPEVARVYESLAQCPDNLLLFMHHVPYTYMLHSGKTVIQHVYDSHYAAADEAQEFPDWWKSLRGHIDDERYSAVLARLQYQAGHAIVWRDAICSWFLRESGIADKQGRAGNFPNRTEAEAIRLEGYEPKKVTPWEDASNGEAVMCPEAQSRCTASLVFKGAPGWYDLDIQYFDVSPGTSHFQLEVADQAIRTWSAGANFPWRMANGDSSTRERAPGVALRPGDTIKIVGVPEAQDRAALDYLEIRPSKRPVQ